MTRAFLARDADAWQLVGYWIEGVSCKPAWRFDCDPKDVTHEVLVVLCDRLPFFRGDSPLENYVRSIAFKICVNHHRKRKKWTMLVDLEHVTLASKNPGPLESIIQNELERIRLTALGTILENASPECLDLWRMRYWERLPCEVVARVMGIAVNTVKTRAWRCVRKAWKALGLPADGGEPLAPPPTNDLEGLGEAT